MNNFLTENNFWTPPVEIIIPTKNWVKNPSFETNNANWSTISSAIITRETSEQYINSACGLLVCTADIGSHIYFDTGVANATDPTKAAILSVYAKATPGTKLHLSIDGAGFSTFTLTDSWQRYKVVSEGVTKTRIHIWAKTPWTAETGSLYLDGIQYEILDSGQTEPTPYCDGAQPNCVWDGTAHASTSTRS